MIEAMLKSGLKPKEIQSKLVEAICNGQISGAEFIEFFKTASDVGKGTCADAMKHVSVQKPGFLAPYIGTLIEYINYKAPRVKWGISEAIGNLARHYPDEAVRAVPYLLRNTVENDVK